MAKIVFKKDKRDQLMLLPPELGELIPVNHLVRVVARVIDQIKLTPLLETYKGGGTSSYSPRMMLKVITYSYISKIYTNRTIEKALKENVNLMWLSGMSTPDYTTIHNFRSKRLKQAVEDIFGSIVEILIDGGYVKAENLFCDGTKIEANASRYSYIWKKNVEKRRIVLKERISDLLKNIDQLQKEEDAEYGDRNLEEISGEITSEKLEKLVTDINEKLSKSSSPKVVSSNVKKLQKDYLPKWKKNEQQSKMLGGRNSCSKTDPDATFFRMKEDHLNTSQLKPAYNIQIGTENQFILGYGVYQKADDTSVFIPVMEKIKKQIKSPLKNIVADSAYGSEENYSYLKDNKLGNYVKYSTFDFEKTSEFKNGKFLSSNFKYLSDEDQYICPNNQKLTFLYIQKSKSENGYISKKRVYKSQTCTNCPQQDQCCKGKHGRYIQRSNKLIEYRSIAKQNLESEKGIKLRSQRGVDVESVFGQIKHNDQFRRFNTHGLPNVSTEWGLICIAHNIKKMAN
jgi:transposase